MHHRIVEPSTVQVQIIIEGRDITYATQRTSFDRFCRLGMVFQHVTPWASCQKIIVSISISTVYAHSLGGFNHEKQAE